MAQTDRNIRYEFLQGRRAEHAQREIQEIGFVSRKGKVLYIVRNSVLYNLYEKFLFDFSTAIQIDGMNVGLVIPVGENMVDEPGVSEFNTAEIIKVEVEIGKSFPDMPPPV